MSENLVKSLGQELSSRDPEFESQRNRIRTRVQFLLKPLPWEDSGNTGAIAPCSFCFVIVVSKTCIFLFLYKFSIQGATLVDGS